MKKNFVINHNKYSKIALNFLGNLVFAYCVIIALALMIFSFCCIECDVAGASMQPTLNAVDDNKHDIVFINKYDKSYNYEDIIVIASSGDDAIIKRVVGLPGDVIDFVRVDGIYKLERNGIILEEDYILINDSPLVPTYSQNGMDTMYHYRWLELIEEKPELFNEEGKLVVGENKIFALGDNRKVSIDSSYYGTFEFSQIQGVVENTKYYGVSELEFYWDYVIQGKFLITLFNAF